MNTFILEENAAELESVEVFPSHARNAHQKLPDVKLLTICLVVCFSDEVEMRENISSSPGSIM